MLRPARLPATGDELADWAVYADALQQRGDPRGETIALELAGHEVEREPLGPDLGGAWMLAHLRHLGIDTNTNYSVDTEALEHAHAIMRSGVAAVLETVRIPFDATKPHLPLVHKLLDALPPSLDWLELDICRPIDEDAALELLDHVPEHVRQVSLWASGRRLQRIGLTGMLAWIDDRFDAIELRVTRSTFDVAVSQLDRDRPAVIERVNRAPGLRLQWIAVAAPFPVGRFEVGRPGDAAIVDLRRRWAMVLSCDRRDDVARALLGRPLVPEKHVVYLYADNPGYLGPQSGAQVILERTGDRWTLTTDYAATNVRVKGTLVPARTTVPLDDGDSIDSDQWDFRFLARDVTPVVRGLLAT